MVFDMWINTNQGASKMEYFKVVQLCALLVVLLDCKPTSGQYSDESVSRCVPFQEGFICSDAPYNETTFPNDFGHQDLDDAQSALNNFVPLIDTNCSKYLKQFLCFVFAPPCTVLETPLKVCRSLCMEAVTTECRAILKEYKQNPEVLKCENYPSVGICIGQNNTISDPSKNDAVGTDVELYPKGDNYYTDGSSSGSKECKYGITEFV